eukprot:364435-Chlamydomonas_euryale.AAC.8
MPSPLPQLGLTCRLRTLPLVSRAAPCLTWKSDAALWIRRGVAAAAVAGIEAGPIGLSGRLRGQPSSRLPS